MDRSVFRLVAVLAAAFVAILCTDAQADTSGTSQDQATDTTQAPASDATGDAAATAADAATDASAVGTTDVSTTADPPAATGTTTTTTPPANTATTPASGATTDATTTASTAVEPAAADAAAAAAAETSPAETDTAGQTSTALVVVSDDSSSSQHTTPAAASSSNTTPPSTGTGSHTGGSGLAALLPTIEHRLQTVQGQIDDMQRQVDAGKRPSKGGLIRLRSSLAQIAPVLLALERRLDAAGQLTARLRRILQRVRDHLSHTQASAADLIAALRGSGLRGPELQLLIDELVRFQALHGNLMPGPALHGPRAILPLEPPAALPWSSSAWSPPVEQPTPAGHASARHPDGSSSGGGAQHHPSKLFSIPGAAAVSSSGAGAAVAFGVLAMLLLGLAAPRLSGRLTVPPGLYRSVVFLAPLERPG
jgi:hypothetical protein